MGGNRHKTVFKSSCRNSDLYFCLFKSYIPSCVTVLGRTVIQIFRDRIFSLLLNLPLVLKGLNMLMDPTHVWLQFGKVPKLFLTHFLFTSRYKFLQDFKNPCGSNYSKEVRVKRDCQLCASKLFHLLSVRYPGPLGRFQWVLTHWDLVNSNHSWLDINPFNTCLHPALWQWWRINWNLLYQFCPGDAKTEIYCMSSALEMPVLWESTAAKVSCLDFLAVVVTGSVPTQGWEHIGMLKLST